MNRCKLQVTFPVLIFQDGLSKKRLRHPKKSSSFLDTSLLLCYNDLNTIFKEKHLYEKHF